MGMTVKDLYSFTDLFQSVKIAACYKVALLLMNCTKI